MIIKTRLFGELDLQEEEVVDIPGGLLGFEGSTRFLIMDDEGIAPFRWLQSVDTPELAFAAINPLLFRHDYRIPVTRELLSLIGHEPEHDVLILAIAVLSRDPRHITANLAGPIVVNAQTMTGAQAILDTRRFDTRAPVYDDLMAAAKSEAPAARPKDVLLVPA